MPLPELKPASNEQEWQAMTKLIDTWRDVELKKTKEIIDFPNGVMPLDVHQKLLSFMPAADRPDALRFFGANAGCTDGRRMRLEAPPALQKALLMLTEYLERKQADRVMEVYTKHAEFVRTLEQQRPRQA